MEQKKIAIYTRVSTAEQAREGYSLEAQERVLKEYCKLKNYEIYNIYSDEGISGGTMEKRPSFLKMIEDSKSQLFDIILVWKLTRFSRSLKDIMNSCEILEKHNVYLESYSESFDSSTPAGRFMRGILGLTGQFEREVLSENIQLGLNQRALKGLRTCSLILGYDNISNGQMAINIKEAEIVRFIFKTYLERKNLTAVANLCNLHDFTGKRGRKFTPQSVLAILTNFVYCGFYRWHGKPIKGEFEPLVSIRDYNKVQSLLMKLGKIYGRKRKNKVVFLSNSI